MQKWDYLTEALGADDLPARGADGWELVAVAGGVMFYKRPAAEAAAPEEVADEPAPVVEPTAETEEVAAEPATA